MTRVGRPARSTQRVSRSVVRAASVALLVTVVTLSACGASQDARVEATRPQQEVAPPPDNRFGLHCEGFSLVRRDYGAGGDAGETLAAAVQAELDTYLPRFPDRAASLDAPGSNIRSTVAPDGNAAEVALLDAGGNRATVLFLERAGSGWRLTELASCADFSRRYGAPVEGGVADPTEQLTELESDG